MKLKSLFVALFMFAVVIGGVNACSDCTDCEDKGETAEVETEKE